MEATAPFNAESFAHSVRSSGCLSLREVARALTQLYDDLLAPLGLQATELGILRVCAASGPLNIAQLASELEATQSLIQRALKPLVAKGLIAKKRVAGHRHLLLELTPDGRQALLAGIERWDQAQEQVVDALGQDGWHRISQQLATLCNVNA